TGGTVAGATGGAATGVAAVPGRNEHHRGMGGPVRDLGLALGIAMVASTVGSVFTTLVVPRVSSARMLRHISNGLGKLAAVGARLVSGYASQDRLLGLVGPLGIVGLFVTWLGLLIVGFGLVLWWSDGISLAAALGHSGSSVFTLAVVSGVVALEIAYLPTLYAAFSAREAEVTLLATRAGVPAWGPEVLARHHRFLTMSELPNLYTTWERWSAAVAESHTNYPTLMWLRSPEPMRSWLTSLVAMLDAAALQDAVSPGAAPRQGRLCLQMGTNCLRSLAAALRISFDPDPLPTTELRLSYEEFLEGVERLRQAGFPFERTAQEAWRHFRGWRVNYEAIVDALTALLVPPPAPWFPERQWLGEAVLPRVLNRTPDDPEASAPRT
ncbi:MAG: hypothetical protein ACRDY3_04430, partial [Acidimicrobiales bacterium]